MPWLAEKNKYTEPEKKKAINSGTIAFKIYMDFVTIDTLGHTDFESIRRQSSQIAHIILVFVDIIKGIE